MWTVCRYLTSARCRSRHAGLGRLAVAVVLASGASSSVVHAQIISQAHVTAELVSEMDSIPLGGPWSMAVRFAIEPGWHIYWKNSGDAGSPTSVRWTTPPGFTAGPVQWPYPKRFDLRPLAVYGYDGTVILPVTLEAPSGLTPGDRATIRVKMKWVVCEKICIAGTAELARELPVGSAAGGTPDPRVAGAFAVARRQLPRRLDEWGVSAIRTPVGLALTVTPPTGWTRPIGDLEFFADSNVVVDHAARQRSTMNGRVVTLALARSSYATKPVARLRGVLVSRGGWDADGSLHGLAVDVPVLNVAVTLPVAVADKRKTTAATTNNDEHRGIGRVAPALPAVGATASTTIGTDTAANGDESMSVPLDPHPDWLLALAFAALGGLLLNLMPCVFPIISLKVLSFVALGGTQRGGAMRHGLAFAAGVIVSFWALAALLLVLRQTGTELGWGFQLQSAPFVAGMALLFFVLALSLLGVFEIGLSLTRLGGAVAATPRVSGSFWTGVLATVVATPCTAPFMGPAIGVALTQPAIYALAVFTVLGAGMALPYVVLAAWPRLLNRLPRPGRWMTTFKRALAFPMLATVAWLVWVLGLQVGIRHNTPTLSRANLASASVPTPAGAPALAWEPFSPARVEALRRAGRPVFIDFTAAWCLSCQVNERLALNHADVRRRLQALDVATLRADWTSNDSVIGRTLAAFGRQGVPLYVLYVPHRSRPIVLPTLLAPATVLEALAEVLAPPVSACSSSPTLTQVQKEDINATLCRYRGPDRARDTSRVGPARTRTGNRQTSAGIHAGRRAGTHPFALGLQGQNGGDRVGEHHLSQRAGQL